MGRPVCGFASRFRAQLRSRLWRPLLRGHPSLAGAGSAERTLARPGAVGPAAPAPARWTRSQGGGLRFPLFAHTTVGEKPDEYYWWEDHVPTRLYLAPGSCNWRLEGTSGRIGQVNSQGGKLVCRLLLVEKKGLKASAILDCYSSCSDWRSFCSDSS